MDFSILRLGLNKDEHPSRCDVSVCEKFWNISHTNTRGEAIRRSQVGFWTLVDCQKVVPTRDRPRYEASHNGGRHGRSSLIERLQPRLSPVSQKMRSRGWPPSIPFSPDLRTYLLRRQDHPRASPTKNRTLTSYAGRSRSHVLSFKTRTDSRSSAFEFFSSKSNRSGPRRISRTTSAFAAFFDVHRSSDRVERGDDMLTREADAP